MKLGLLMQPAFEVVSDPTLSGGSTNLFVRRARFLVGGTLFKDFEYFFETDSSDVFKGAGGAGATGTKTTPGMNVQDAFGTWKAVGDQFKIDLGYMLLPLNHNAVQGAGTLYSWDYFTNSFRHSALFNSAGSNPAGRDAGVQLRGLLADGLIEYRLGMFQGKRVAASATDVGARNMFRFSGRVQINLLDPETGFFYGGTYLGSKKIFSLGGTFDVQGAYKRFGGDAFVDLPAGPGVFTAQVNFVHADGSDFLTRPNATAGMPDVPTLPKQNALMAEAGYLIDAINVSPIARFESQWISEGNTETRMGGGLAFWPYGHNVNVKAFYQRVSTAPQTGSSTHFDQFNLQTQFYVF